MVFDKSDSTVARANRKHVAYNIIFGIKFNNNNNMFTVKRTRSRGKIITTE